VFTFLLVKWFVLHKLLGQFFVMIGF